MAAGSTTVPGDTAVAVGSVDEMPDAQRFLAIEWSADGDSGRSHYLAGRPPFALGDYARWIRDWGLGTVAHAE